MRTTIDFEKFNRDILPHQDSEVVDLNPYPESKNVFRLNVDGSFNFEEKTEPKKFDARLFWEQRLNRIGFLMLSCSIILLLLFLDVLF